jgi:hypothetical protein
MSEEQEEQVAILKEKAEEARRLGYGPGPKSTEDVSEEEEEEETRAERIAGDLPGWGIGLLLLSWALGMGMCSSLDDGGDLEAGRGLFLTFFGAGILVWLFCRAARYILIDIATDIRKENPNLVGRLGRVIYWLGCAVGILSFPVGVLVWIDEGHMDDPADSLLALVFCLAVGAAAWLVGRIARYVLKGD